jgi:hypothetical protein
MRQIRANATRPSTSVVANAHFSLRTLRQTSFFPRSLDIALRFAGSSPVPSFGSLLSRNSFPCFPLFGSPVVLTGRYACEVSYWKKKQNLTVHASMVQINQNPCRVAGGTGRRVGFLIILFFVFFVVVFFRGGPWPLITRSQSKWESFFFGGGPWPPYQNVHPKCNRPILLLLLLYNNAKKKILGTYFLLWSSISSTFFLFFSRLYLGE